MSFSEKLLLKFLKKKNWFKLIIRYNAAILYINRQKYMIQDAKKDLEKALSHLESEFSKLQMWRANPALVEWIMIEQYGSLQAIKNIASVNILDNQTLSIAPWDKSIVHAIAKAITDAWVGLNPQTQADSVLIRIPPMTEERRKEMVKVVKKFTEDGKVSVRNVRGDYLKKIKRQETDKEISEDVARDLERDLQKLIDEANKTVEEVAKKKESDIMKV